MSKYGVDWPTEPGDIIREALRECGWDDELVLFDFLDGIATHIEELAEYEEVYGCRAMNEAAQIMRRYANG